MIVYKLTDKEGKTKNGTSWGENVTHEVTGALELCKNGIHAYSDPLLAALHNSIHGEFDLSSALLWKGEASDEHLDDAGMKSCHRWLRTIKQIPIPEVNLTQKIAYGILCAKEVCDDKNWNKWALRWLSGEDRSYTSAYAAYAYTTYAATYADDAYAAAHAAVHAAHAAAAAADASDAAHAAYAAAYAVHAAAAARVASDARGKKIDLIKIAKKAMKIK